MSSPRSFKSMAFHIRLLALSLPVLANCFSLNAQDTTKNVLPDSKHAAIIFPYPMYKEKWRSSIGFTSIATPEDITEEVRIRVPAIDFRVQRKITPHFIADGRINAQILQNQFYLGAHYVYPISDQFFASVGTDVGYWFGFLKSDDGFNSRGSGWLAYPWASIGYRSKKNLLITLKGSLSYNLQYVSYSGNEKLTSSTAFYNGEAFGIFLEQPFYHKTHIALGFSAIRNYFFWQTWALYYANDRKIFYPQITVAFIL